MSPRHPIAIAPLLREIDHLRAQGHYEHAAELEGTLQTPITVRGREYERKEDDLTWWQWHGVCEDVALFAYRDRWHALLTACADDSSASVRVHGDGPTPEAAIDAACRVSLEAVTARLDALRGELDKSCQRR